MLKKFIQIISTVVKKVLQNILLGCFKKIILCHKSFVLNLYFNSLKVDGQLN